MPLTNVKDKSGCQVRQSIDEMMTTLYAFDTPFLLKIQATPEPLLCFLNLSLAS